MNALDVLLWPHQKQTLTEVPRLIVAGKRKICVTTPTGGGKTTSICRLIEWALSLGWQAILYTNRRLLINQLSNVLGKSGIEFGVRASGHEDRRERPVQISSLPTERQRVIKAERWDIHGADGKVLVIVDEAHLNKSDTAQQILAMHAATGAAYVGFTATPIELGHLYDELLVAGTPSELRDCGALVRAYHFGPDEPDMKGFKANIKTGEYSEKDVRKAVMTKCVFSRVLDNYRTLNPEQRPTILFGPGVKESIWFAEQFEDAGIRAAHIDGEGAWIDGEYSRTVDREEILNDVRAGRIHVLCNRFVLREGLDLPEVSHLILATVMGSLQTYLQSCGRGLRACEGKDRCTIQDHGGHWWRHGSVNIDRDWNLGHTETMIRGMREEKLRNKMEPEPIRCAKCGQVRASGPVCQSCGFQSSARSRMVVQQDGTIREHSGDIFKPRYTRMTANTQRIWIQTYHRAKNSKNKMTFRQAEGLFVYENGYWPPRDLPLMPIHDLDWYLPVCEVAKERLS